MASEFAGKVVLVTGGGNGIGAATCRAFARAGAHVAILDRDRAAAEAVAKEIAGRGGHATAHAIDVADRGAFAAATAEIAEAAGGIDILVNGAGTTVRRMIPDMSPEDWDRVIAVNLTGAFNVVRALLASLREARGDVVLIGSVSGSWPDPSGPAYQAAKAGLLAFARAAGFEEHAGGVRFTTVLPGVVDTPILDRRPEPPPPEVRAHMLQPEDVAAACLFAITLPRRAHVAELTILPTALQAVGKTNVGTPEVPHGKNDT